MEKTLIIKHLKKTDEGLYESNEELVAVSRTGKTALLWDIENGLPCGRRKIKTNFEGQKYIETEGFNWIERIYF